MTPVQRDRERRDAPARGAAPASAPVSEALSSPLPGSHRPSPPDATSRLAGLRHLVGNSPLLALHFERRGVPGTVFAKAENLNMTGSVKDRMALHVIRQGYERGLLRPGDGIAEATSGNTGISIAGIGRALGHQVTIFMPDWMSRERVDLIRSLGADVRLVSREDGGFLECIDRAETLAASRGNVFLPRQFSNDENVRAHERTTGPEIWWQLAGRGLEPDAFVAGVGTGGTIMGVGRYLRRMKPTVKLHPLEPASSPTLSTGHKVGSHRIAGISDEFVPSIVDLGFLDDIVSVSDGDAIRMAQKLAAEIGLGVGISAGANMLGAILAHERLGPESVVVTLFPDDNKKYLSTDLVADAGTGPGDLSAGVTLRGFTAVKRVCRTCFEPGDEIDLLAAPSAPVDPSRE